MTDNWQAGLRARHLTLLLFPALLILSLLAATASASPQALRKQEGPVEARDATTRNAAPRDPAPVPAPIVPAREAAASGEVSARDAGLEARARNAGNGAEEEGRATHGSEPATWLLLATGLGIILLFHRQRLRLRRRERRLQDHGEVHGGAGGHRPRGQGPHQASPLVPPAGR
jgi:hypothetical protein